MAVDRVLQTRDQAQQLVGDQPRMGRLGLWQQHRELVPAQARQHVRVAQLGRQRLGDPDDELVAGGVAEAVVDVFEVVEVDEQQRAARVVAAHVRELVLERALEAAAVEQPGERVVVGHVAQLLLVAAPAADVLDLGDEAQRPTAVVAQQRDVQLHQTVTPSGRTKRFSVS